MRTCSTPPITYFKAKGGATGIILKPTQFTAYASLALGSALAAFMYPHTMTAVLSSSSAATVRKNAIFLPAYTLLLGLIALLGYMAIAAGMHVQVGLRRRAGAVRHAVPVVVRGLRGGGDCDQRAGAGGDHVDRRGQPVHAQSVASARGAEHARRRRKASTAKIVSLVVKFGALLFIVFLPTQYAIDLQLLGGVWILQIFPAIVFSLYTRRLNTPGLFLGWLVGIVLGTGLAIAQGLKPVFALHLGDATYPLYIGLIALAVNIVVAFVVSVVTPKRRALEGALQ